MSRKDVYTQRMYQSVTESAPGTVSYEQFNLQQWGFGKNEAMLISQIQYSVGADYWNLILAESDHIQFGLSTANVATTISLRDPTNIDLNQYGFRISGTPAVDEIIKEEFIRNFTTLPGGGLLTIPAPLYVYCQGVSLASAITVAALVFFTMVALKPQDFIELTQIMRMAV